MLAEHPSFELAFATSDRLVSAPVGRHVGARCALSFEPNEAALSLSERVDGVVLATPAQVSLALVPELIRRGKRVIDLSGAFRLKDAACYPRWYGFEHTAPALLSIAHYGVPELFGNPQGALVANPGCYPTAALLALSPLIRAGLIDVSQPIIVDGKSGVSGAGRQSKEEYSFCEIAEDVRAYKVLAHQHTPEIAQALAASAGAKVHVVFTPHLVPVRRGLVTTCYARPAGDLARSLDVERALRAAYEPHRFVEVVAAGEATMASVVGTNRARVGVAVEDEMIVAVCAIDNLLKGAAGQALQNLHALFGLDDGALDRLQRSAP